MANLTGSVSPSSGTINSTLFTITGSATPNVSVTCTETAPNGTISTFNFQANSAGNYSSSPFTLSQVGQYACRLRDPSTGQQVTVTSLCPSLVNLTGSVSPSSGTINSTQFTISGHATPNANVTCTETAPNGTISNFTYPVNSSGNYS